MATQAVNAKNKTAAILLAVFLGFWTWLYTYQKDGWKFWVSLALTLAGMAVLIYTTVNIITARNSPAVASDPLTAWMAAWVVAYIITGSLWLWGILDTALKKRNWYENYPG